MSDKLPPLPVPDKQGCEDDPMYGIQPVNYYTAEQMQAYARAAIEHHNVPAGSLALDAAIGYIERHTPHLVYSEIKAALAAVPQPQPVQESVAPVGTVTRYLGNDGYMKWAFQPEAAAWLVPRDQRAAERGAESRFSVYTSPQAQAAHGITKGTT